GVSHSFKFIVRDQSRDPVVAKVVPNTACHSYTITGEGSVFVTLGSEYRIPANYYVDCVASSAGIITCQYRYVVIAVLLDFIIYDLNLILVATWASRYGNSVPLISCN